MLPKADNTYNLGSSSYRWSDIYGVRASLINDGTGPILKLTAPSGTPWAIEFYRSDLDAYARVFLSSGYVLRWQSNMLPHADNTYDLGSSSYRWRDLHLYRYLKVPDVLRVDGAPDDMGGCIEQLLHMIWQGDVLRFQSATVEYWDGSAWVAWGDDSWKNALDGRLETYFTVPTDKNHLRFTFNLWNYVRIYAVFVFIRQDVSGTIRIYTSSDGSTWTLRKEVTYPSGYLHNFIIIRNLPDSGADSYFRVEFELNTTTNVSFHMLAGIGWQKSPLDRNFPFITDWNRNLLPPADNTYDLGSSSYRWKDLYLAQYARFANAYGLIADGGAKLITGSGGGTWHAYQGNTDAWVFSGKLTDGTTVFYINNTGDVNARNVTPISDNAYDLGSSSYRWKDGYFAGNIKIDGYLHKKASDVWIVYGEALDADNTNTLRNSPYIQLQAKYWDGAASQTVNLAIGHYAIDTAPTTRCAFYFAGTMKAYIDNSGNSWFAGNIASDGYGNFNSLQIGGTEVITSARKLQNIASIIQSLLPDADNTYDLGSSSYRWRDLYVNRYGYIRTMIQVDNVQAEKVRLIGPTSQFRHSLQDGTGRVQWYWNSTVGTSPTYIVSDEPAGKIDFHPPSGSIDAENAGFTISYAPSGTAGDAITWERRFALKLNTGEWKFYNTGYIQTLLPTSDNTYDLGSSSYRWRNIYCVNLYDIDHYTENLHTGDIELKNGMRITEAERFGVKGLAILNRQGKPILFITEDGEIIGGGKIYAS